MKTEDKSLLRYAGFLGHRYVIVIDHGTGRTVAMECNTLASAFKGTEVEYAQKNPTIYEQFRRGKWKKVL